MEKNADAFSSKLETMTTEPVEKLVCRLAGPSMIIMMVSAMYNTADTYFVSSLGTSATGAVGVSFSLMAIIQAVGFFFGHGTGNYISRALGAGNNTDAVKMASTGFFTAFIIGSIIAVTGTLFISPLAVLLGSTDTILPYAVQYLRFILLGAPFMVSSLMLNNLLRFQGSAFFGMIGMTGGAVLNIALDPLFIFVFGLGVTGASLATMLSQMLSFVLLFVVGCNGKKNVPIHPKNFVPCFSIYKEMFRGGTPSLLRQGLISISTIFLNHRAGFYGDAVIAAISIVNRVFMTASAALIGLGQGFQPVCGFNYGAKKYDRVKKAFWFCLRISTVMLTVLGAACFILAPEIISLFRKDDPEVIKTGSLALRMYCSIFPLAGWIVLVSMMTQTMGKAFFASFLAFSRQGLFMIPLIFILTPLLGVLGIQLCHPLADLLTFVISLPVGISVLRKDLATTASSA